MEKNTPTTLAQVHNLLIIDESGSMGLLQEATIDGVNKVLDTIRQAQQEFAESQQHYVTVVTFASHRDSNVNTLVDNAPIAQVRQFDKYRPGGGTPLFDAIGTSLTRLEQQLDGQDLATAVVTIVTDGRENSSREYTYAKVRQLIERLTAKGWTFSYMGACHDVEATALGLGIGNSVEFAHSQRGTTSSWQRDLGAKRAHFLRINRDIDTLRDASESERAQLWGSYGSQYYTSRVTPPMVVDLHPGQVFVFGSNIHGDHNGSAAAQALHQFGAVMGQAEGPQGQSYAIPTTDGVFPLPLGFVADAVRRFLAYAREHPDTHFLVTAIGCGNAGFTPQQMAPLFETAISLENVSLPAAFWQELGIRPK